VSGHADTALDQLRLADDLAETREQMHAAALAAAQVHASLALAEAVLKAGLDPWAFAAQPRS
jgi:peptide deformylase